MTADADPDPDPDEDDEGKGELTAAFDRAARLAPMTAVAGPLPAGDDWAFEIKWDGVRVVTAVGVEGGSGRRQRWRWRWRPAAGPGSGPVRQRRHSDLP